MAIPSDSKAVGYTVELGARGRLVIPARLRKQLGLKEGDRLVVTLLEDGDLRLKNMRRAAKQVQGIFKDLASGRSLVDELLTERQEEASSE